MPLAVAQKINVEPKICNTMMVQMDISGVIVIGKLSDVFIILSSNLVVT